MCASSKMLRVAEPKGSGMLLPVSQEGATPPLAPSPSCPPPTPTCSVCQRWRALTLPGRGSCTGRRWEAALGWSWELDREEGRQKPGWGGALPDSRSGWGQEKTEAPQRPKAAAVRTKHRVWPPPVPYPGKFQRSLVVIRPLGQLPMPCHGPLALWGVQDELHALFANENTKVPAGQMACPRSLGYSCLFCLLVLFPSNFINNMRRLAIKCMLALRGFESLPSTDAWGSLGAWHCSRWKGEQRKIDSAPWSL